MNKYIFVINGSGGVGKDTFVDLVRKSSHSGVVNYSSVDKIKEIAKLVGWTGGKTDRDRKFLSDLKFLCSDYSDLPFACMRNEVNSFNEGDNEFLFLHIREPGEIERAKREFGAKSILIKRNSVNHITSNDADKNVFNCSYDIVVHNDGDIFELQMKASHFVEDVYAGKEEKIY